MHRVVHAALAGAMIIGLSGCATVMNGTSQPVEFQSDPDGARVELINGLSCQTPCRYEMKRGNDSRATFTREGYQTVSVFIQSRTGGSAFGNILAGGIIGGVVDGTNGASNHLYPDPVYVRMVPNGSTEKPLLLDQKGVVISTVDEYNAKVATDVIEGLQGQGLLAAGQSPR